MSGKYALMIPWRRREELLSIDEVSARSGLHPEFIKRLVVLGLIDPEDHAELFHPDVMLRLQRMVRLRRDLGVNYNAAALVLDLLERIDRLEARLHRLER